MKTRTKTRRIIIHCSATRAAWMAGSDLFNKVETIKSWHVHERGWSDIGYHLIIDRDGGSAIGRPEHLVGAHTRGHNADSYAICILGGHGSGADNAPEDNFTPVQIKALVREVQRVKEQYPGIQTIHGHNEFAAKACPGFTVADHWNRLVSEYGVPLKPAPKPKPVPWWTRFLTSIKGK